jgi:hypothetical protein
MIIFVMSLPKKRGAPTVQREEVQTRPTGMLATLQTALLPLPLACCVVGGVIPTKTMFISLKDFSVHAVRLHYARLQMGVDALCLVLEYLLGPPLPEPYDFTTTVPNDVM